MRVCSCGGAGSACDGARYVTSKELVAAEPPSQRGMEAQLKQLMRNGCLGERKHERVKGGWSVQWSDHNLSPGSEQMQSTYMALHLHLHLQQARLVKMDKLGFAHGDSSQSRLSTCEHNTCICPASASVHNLTQSLSTSTSTTGEKIGPFSTNLCGSSPQGPRRLVALEVEQRNPPRPFGRFCGASAVPSRRMQRF